MISLLLIGGVGSPLENEPYVIVLIHNGMVIFVILTLQYGILCR